MKIITQNFSNPLTVKEKISKFIINNGFTVYGYETPGIMPYLIFLYATTALVQLIKNPQDKELNQKLAWIFIAINAYSAVSRLIIYDKVPNFFLILDSILFLLGNFGLIFLCTQELYKLFLENNK